MGTTTRYAWPYPEQSDGPDGPDVAGDMANLAGAVEESVGTIDDRLTTLTGLSQSIMQYTTLTRVSASILSIPTNVWTAITWDAAQYNLPASTPGFVLASPTRITCMQTGLYRLSGFAGFAMDTAGSRGLALRLNNSSYTAISSGVPPDDIEWYGAVNVEARVNATDYLELVMRQTTGANLLMDTVHPRFSMQRLL